MNMEWIWQYVFPASSLVKDAETGVIRRHHLHETAGQKAVKEAAHHAKINKHVTHQTFRYSFVTPSLQSGYDIRIIQELLGHKDTKTTMIYTDVVRQAPELSKARWMLENFPTFLVSQPHCAEHLIVGSKLEILQAKLCSLFLLSLL